MAHVLDGEAVGCDPAEAEVPIACVAESLEGLTYRNRSRSSGAVSDGSVPSQTESDAPNTVVWKTVAQSCGDRDRFIVPAAPAERAE